MMYILGLAVLPSITSADPALAYIGPGAGIGLILAFLGLLFGIVMAIGAVMWWPIRQLLRRRRKRITIDQQPASSGLGERGGQAERRSDM